MNKLTRMDRKFFPEASTLKSNQRARKLRPYSKVMLDLEESEALAQFEGAGF